MIVSGRQKITIVSLSFYWVLLFVSSHIPIPKLVYQANVSDKLLHFLAYMNLFFLLWFSVNPDGKASWRSWSIWLIITGAFILGGIDELTQPYVGRTCDILDFVADAEGILGGLIIFVFLSFWPSFLAVWAITIFGVATLIKADPSKVAPNLDAVYHILAYAGFTLVWAKLINLYLSAKTTIRRFLLMISVPLGFMLFVKILSVLLGRYFTSVEMLLSGGAIIVAAIATCLLKRKRGQEPFLAKGV